MNPLLLLSLLQGAQGLAGEMGGGLSAPQPGQQPTPEGAAGLAAPQPGQQGGNPTQAAQTNLPGGQPIQQLGQGDLVGGLLGGAMSGLGMVTGLASNIASPFLARQRADELRKRLSGPTAAELQAQQVAAQAGGIARSIPGMAPAAASRAANNTLLQAQQQLAPARAREQMARAQLIRGAEADFGNALTSGLAGIAGGLASAGALGSTTGQPQPQAPASGLGGAQGLLAGSSGAPRGPAAALGSPAPAQAQPAQQAAPQAAPIQETGDPFAQMPWGQPVGPEVPWTAPPQQPAMSPQQMQQDQIQNWIMAQFMNPLSMGMR